MIVLLMITQDPVLPTAAAPISTIKELGILINVNFLTRTLQPMQIIQLSASDLQE